jgi:polysaccharide export outer membrane protein
MNLLSTRSATVLLLLLASAGGARAQGGTPADSVRAGLPADSVRPGDDPPARFSDAARAADATTMSPGDIVRVEIWQERDVSGDFLVQADGSAVLPLLGEQRIAGIPVGVLRDSLRARYRKLLRNPSINITPLRRVQVLGEVMRPGVYVMDPTVSLSGLLAMASGANQNGDVRKISILRDGRVYRPRLGAGMTLLEADVRSGDQVVVGQKSWAVRNSVFLVGMIPGALLTLLTVLDRVRN